MRVAGLVLLFTLTSSVAGPAQQAGDGFYPGYTPAPHTWSSDHLHLRFQYPDLLRELPAASAVSNGRIHLLGLDADRLSDSNKTDLTACLQPLLFARTPDPTPAATTSEQTAPNGDTTVHITPAPVAALLLADLDVECLSGHDQVTRTDLLSTLSQQFLTTPGMTRNAGPSTYTIGYQRVTMAAAQGRPEGSTATPVFTMAIATNWSNHLLVWLLSSNQIQLLNQLAGSTVRFGRASAQPLYPEPLGNSTPAATR